MNKKRIVLTLVTLLVFGAIIALHYITPNIFEYFRFRGGGTDLGWVNVKDAPYNATGDGVTDDTAAIQAAINAVFASGGGTVFLPRGIYLCNGAFDATTNSILKIPYQPITTAPNVYNDPVTVQLIGEFPGFVAAKPLVNGTIIKSTKTGTGTAPAILAAYAYLGRALTFDWIHAFSYTQVFLRNLQFQTVADPTIYGVRLDTCIAATLENVQVATAATVSGDLGLVYPEPTHGTVGLWLPDSQNFASIICKDVWVMGFDTGIVTGENFRAWPVNIVNSHVAIELLHGAGTSVGLITIDHCNTMLKFSGPHWVDFTVLSEVVTSGWQVPTPGSDIIDAGSGGHGIINYKINKLDVGPQLISPTGASNLRLINLDDAGNFYFGADLRMVPITGGGKLQARNPGTNTWADVDQWTNP